MEHLALTLVLVIIHERATMEGLTVLSLFYENVSIAPFPRVVGAMNYALGFTLPV